MQIETKFDVGDKPWFIDGTGKLLEVNITDIEIKVSCGTPNDNFVSKTVIEYLIKPTSESNYTFNSVKSVKENKLYKTKQKAGEAWLKSQGLKCGVSDD